MSVQYTSISTSNIDRRLTQRLRPLDPETVAMLAESMKEIGLQQPIVLRRAHGRCYLVAGLHRLEAAKSLGWKEIPALFVDNDTDDRTATLIEIDENLKRADLSPAERAHHLAERKRLWTGRKGKGGSQPKSERKVCAPKPDFTEDTAAKTGKARRTIQLDTERGEKIALDVLDKIKGTPLDKGKTLDTLKRMQPEEQRKFVDDPPKQTVSTLSKTDPSWFAERIKRDKLPDVQRWVQELLAVDPDQIAADIRKLQGLLAGVEQLPFDEATRQLAPDAHSALCNDGFYGLLGALENPNENW